jgi:hypothetical protein
MQAVCIKVLLPVRLCSNDVSGDISNGNCADNCNEEGVGGGGDALDEMLDGGLDDARRLVVQHHERHHAHGSGLQRHAGGGGGGGGFDGPLRPRAR